MKTKIFFLILILSICFCQSYFAQRGVGNQTISKLPSKEKRWALIIGVDNYGLKGAVNDAKALKNALVKYAGFPENQIVLLTTEDSANLPDRRNILVELDKLSRTVPTDGLFLFAFSGHGKTVADNAYLIPSDGQMTNNNRLLREISIDVKSVKEAIEEMQVKQVLMLIDACRDRIEGKGNESEPLTPAVTRGFSFDEANKTIEAFITLYATRLGEFAYEFFDKETNQYRGYFSRALEEGLSGKAANEKGEVTLANLVKYIEDTVPAKSYRNEGKRQIPWKNTNNGYKENELILAVIKANEIVSFVSAADIEREAFEAIQNSTDVNEIRAVLEEYPTSRYASDPRKRLDKLVWESVKNSRDKAKIQAYLDEFGDKGQFVSLARIEIRKLAIVSLKPSGSIVSNNQNVSPISNTSASNSEAVSLADRALSEVIIGKEESALKLAEQALKTNGNLPLAIAVKVWVKYDGRAGYNQSTQNELLKNELERAVKREPKNALFQALLIDIYQHLGKYSSSVKTAKKVLSMLKSPSTAMDYFSRGLANHRMGNNAEAINDFTKAIKLNPGFAYAYFFRAAISYGNRDSAKADYLKAAEINPNFPDVCGNAFYKDPCGSYYSFDDILRKKALEFYYNKKYDEAISEFTKVIEFYPGLFDYQNRGVAYFDKQDYDAAIRDFDVVIKNDPNWSAQDVYWHRAYSYYKKGNYVQTIADYTKSIERSPSSSAYNNRAIAYDAIGETAKAEADRLKAAELRKTQK